MFKSTYLCYIRTFLLHILSRVLYFSRNTHRHTHTHIGFTQHIYGSFIFFIILTLQEKQTQEDQSNQFNKIYVRLSLQFLEGIPILIDGTDAIVRVV